MKDLVKTGLGVLAVGIFFLLMFSTEIAGMLYLLFH